MKHHEIEQNTDEWFTLRRGKFTCSTFKNLFLKPSTATYQREINRVVFEKLTGKSPESFTTEYMLRGSGLEALAKEYYEAEKLEVVNPGGFFEVDEWTGGSPDGIVNDGLLEIKCPSFNTMIEYLKAKKLPSEYLYQVQGHMMISGRNWCDFMAYHPDLPILILRVERDEKIINEIQKQIKIAVELVKETIKQIS